MLPGIEHQRICCLYQVIKRGVSTCLKLHFETSRSTQSRNDRRRGKIDLAFGIFLQILLHILHYLIDGNPLTLFPRFQNNRQLTACLVATHTGAATRHVLHIGHIGILLQVLHGTVGHHTGSLQSSTFRQLQLYLKIALVFYRQEAGRHQPVDNENGNQYQAERTHQAAGIPDDPVNDSHVFVIAQVQPFIDFAENYILFLSTVGLQYERTHDGTKRQGHYRRKQYGNGDSNGKLTV